MKKALISLLIFCSFTSCSNSEERSVVSIKGDVEEIDSNISKFLLVEQEIMDQSAEGGVLKGYCEGGELQKLTAEFLGETGRAIMHFYLKNGKLIFAVDQVENFDRPITAGKVKPVSNKKKSFFVANGKLIAAEGNAEEWDNSREIMKDFNEFKERIECERGDREGNGGRSQRVPSELTEP